MWLAPLTVSTNISRSKSARQCARDKRTAPKNDGSTGAAATELRSWKWTYNALGQVLTAKDPLSKTTTTVYYAATDTVTYKVNALGQRIQKIGAGQYAYTTSTTINATTRLSPQANTIQFNARYVYDEQGRLLGEYSPEGKLISETIWFDDLPVATIRPIGSSAQKPLGTAGTGAGTANNTGTNTPTNPVNVDTFYLHPDHLGTPRVATRSVAVNNATTGPNAVNKAV